MFFFELKQKMERSKSKTCVDTIDCFSYINPALHTTRGLTKNCGKAVSMRDYYSSCVNADFQPSLYYLAQFLSNQSNHSTDRTPDAEVLRPEPRERRTALVVDDVAVARPLLRGDRPARRQLQVDRDAAVRGAGRLGGDRARAVRGGRA